MADTAAVDDQYTPMAAAEYHALLDACVDAIIVIDEQGRISTFNRAAERLFGYAEADVLGKNVSVLMPEPDRSRHDGYVGRYLGTGEARIIGVGRETVGRHADGTLLPIALSVGEACDASGRRFVGVIRDLSSQRAAEQRARSLDARLAHLGRFNLLGEMAAGIAHELKNPLAGIEVMAGLLRRQVPDSASAQSLLADIISESKLANAIVVEMLEFVRPLRLQVERTDVAHVLHQAITLAESKVPRGGVEVTVNLGPDLPAIEGDPLQLCQLFTNLLANAFEALEGQGRIGITAVTALAEVDPAMAGLQPPTPTLIVEVADNGPGVPAELTDKIFNPFFTTKPKGSGLGLAIVRKIVDAHDGRIDVSSSGAGTRFRVTLPVASAPAWFK
jgi:two-component system sensor kinase FixL